MNGEPLPGAIVLFRPRTAADDSAAKGAAESFGKTDKNDRRNHYEVLTDQPLRHAIERHKSIGDLLHLVSE